MSDAPPSDEEEAQKASKLPLIIGVILALAGGGGGFFAVWSGMILQPSAPKQEASKSAGEEDKLDIAYVAIDPLVISLPSSSSARHLKFRAQLEVPTAAEEEVGKVLPRVVDVLNSYLRALEPSDLEDPASLTRLRSQMLHRVQVVTGEGKVNDLLIMEFVLT